MTSAFVIDPRNVAFAARPVSSFLTILPNPSHRSRPAAPAAPAISPAVAPLHWLSAQLFTESLKNYEANNFVRFLLTRFDPETVERAIDRYGVGTSEGGKTIFWQIDRQGRVRTGKIILYDPETGRRSKTVLPDWVHAELKRRKLLPSDFELRQCFFGEHQLPDEPAKTVAVVEAEKTAIVSSIIQPSFLWLAIGGKSHLKVEKLERLQRKVKLFPDADGFAAWSKVAAQARLQGLNIDVSDLIEVNATPEQKAAGYDLADYFLELECASPSETDILPALLHLLENLTADEHESLVNQLEARTKLLTANGWSRLEALDRAERELYLFWRE